MLNSIFVMNDHSSDLVDKPGFLRVSTPLKFRGSIRTILACHFQSSHVARTCQFLITFQQLKLHWIRGRIVSSNRLTLRVGFLRSFRMPFNVVQMHYRTQMCDRLP